MEWVEVTGKTVEEAKDAALDQLGVDESEAEFEVVQEPKAGLFGRLRSEARVRARVQPTAVRPKVDRGSRRRGRKDREESHPAPAAGGSGTGPAPQPAPTAPTRAANGGGRANGGARGGGRGEGPRSERRPKVAADKGEAMYDAEGPAGDASEVG